MGGVKELMGCEHVGKRGRRMSKLANENWDLEGGLVRLFERTGERL